MIALFAWIGISILMWIIARVLEWIAQDKHNDDYDKRKGGK